MNWFALALLSAIIFSWVTIIDKLMVGQNFTDPVMYSLFIKVYGLVTATAYLFLAGGWQLLSWWVVAAGMLAGALKVGSGMIYFYALTKQDASLVSTVEQTRPLFALLLGVWFLGELLPASATVGIGIIVMSTGLLSLERKHLTQHGIQFNRIVPLILLANILHSLAGLYLKIILKSANVGNGYFWEAMGGVVTAMSILLIWKEGRQRIKQMLLKVRRWAYVGSACNEIIANIGGLILTTAFATGPLAGVTTLYATQPLFIPPFIWLANRLRPAAITPESREGALLPRGAIVLFLLSGIYFLGAST